MIGFFTYFREGASDALEASVLHAAALALLASLIAAPDASAQNRQPPAVIVEPAHEADFTTNIEALGTLQPNERVELTVNAADRVTAIYFDDGDRVEEGKTLLALAQAEQRANVEAAEARLREAQSFVERLRPLVADGGVSGAQFEEAERNVDVARAELASLRVQQNDRYLVAPFAGVLGFRQVSEGAYVQPGDVVATLIDDRRMRLEFAVPARFLSALAPGVAVRAETAAYRDRVFEGRVTSVDNAVDPTTHSVAVRAVLPNEEGLLRAGLFMEVTLEAAPRTALAAPEESIEPVGAESFVFVVAKEGGDFIARRRGIETGQRANGFVEIVSGLEAGELIIVEGGIRARDGAPVRIGDPAIFSGARELALGGETPGPAGAP